MGGFAQLLQNLRLMLFIFYFFSLSQVFTIFKATVLENKTGRTRENNGLIHLGSLLKQKKSKCSNS